MYRKLEELTKKDLEDKKVFLRVDFSVPMEGGKLKEVHQIKAHRETVDFLTSTGAKIALVSHTENKSIAFRYSFGEIGKILGQEIAFEEDILNPKLDSQLTLFEDIRRYEGEEINDPGFAEDLAKNFDIYINDAFSVSHREHASVSAITGFLPSYAGLLMGKEVKDLKKVLDEPVQGKTIILGGAKVLTKLPVVKNFLDKAEHILIGGALANTIFKKRGLKIGKSVFEDIEEQIDWNNPKIVLPKDLAVSEDRNGKTLPEVIPVRDIDENQMILDIGPDTIKEFSKIIKNSKTVIFNGPLGLAEVDVFSTGTKTILDSIIRSGAFSVVGGGDTLALIEKLGLANKFGYVSTGGGAMLEFLAGNELPGLDSLGYYND